MTNVFFEGLLLQASLIFALGAQNIFVFEAGLKRRHHLTVSLVCFLCDFFLIFLGVAGAASLFTHYPLLKIMIGVLGVVFLFTYGLGKVLAPKQEFSRKEENVVDATLKKSIILAATFSILNPHAYLDAFVIIGGFSTKYNDINDRLMLGFGAAIYSGVWFLILSSLSSYMKPVIEHPARMKAIMSLAGFVLIFLSGKLGMDVFSWIQGDSEYQIAFSDLMSYPWPPGKVFTSILF